MYKYLSELKAQAPKLFGVPTGTGLDELFLTIKREGNRLVKKPLGGIPYRAVINVVGIPDSGKSVLAEQFALTQAFLGYKVLFITTENKAEFLYNSAKIKAEALNYDMDRIEKHIVVVDLTDDDNLRENVASFLDKLEDVVREEKTTVAVVDSITGFYEHKEVMARQIVRKIYSFFKKHHHTALFVSQKRSSQHVETAEAAGGLAVAHIVDGTIVLDKKLILTPYEERIYNIPIGNIIRLLRIDGCRITAHDDRVWVFKITQYGTFELIVPLEKWVARKNNK